MSNKIELKTLKGKLNLFNYLIHTDKNWCIKNLIVLGVYILILVAMSIGLVVDRIKYGALSSVMFNLFSNALVMLLLGLVVIVVICIVTYTHVGKSITSFNTTIEFNDAERKLTIEYTDLIGKIALKDSDDTIITSTVNYRDIVNIGVIEKYCCIDIHGFFKTLSTDSIVSNNISYSAGNKKDTSDNVVLFLSKDEMYNIVNRLNTLREVQYFNPKDWYSKEETKK